MDSIANCLKVLYQKSIFNTPKKKGFIISILIYYPIITLLVGNPYPDTLRQIEFPLHLFNIDEAIVKIIETASTTLGLIGSVSVGVFWIHKKSNNKHEETREDLAEVDTKLETKMDTLDKNLRDHVDDKFDLLCQKMDQQKRETDSLFSERMNNVQNQIVHIKDTAKDLKQRVDKIDNNLFHLRSSGGQQE